MRIEKVEKFVCECKNQSFDLLKDLKNYLVNVLEDACRDFWFNIEPSEEITDELFSAMCEYVDVRRELKQVEDEILKRSSY